MDNIPDIVKDVGKVLGWIIGGDGSPKTPQSEDCELSSTNCNIFAEITLKGLTLNVIRPSNYSSYPNGSLPVLVVSIFLIFCGHILQLKRTSVDLRRFVTTASHTLPIPKDKSLFYRRL